MRISNAPLEGVKIIEPVVFTDERGYFFESFNHGRFSEAIVSHPFVQDNESRSARGVVRGLHYQLAPHGQAKLVRVVAGCVFDVAVDLRKGSATFGKWFGTILSDKNKLQMFIPAGFAHGFSVLSAEAVFAYKCDHYYCREMERAIRFDDPFLNIDWQLPENEWRVSEKDLEAPFFREAEMNFE